MNNNCKVTEALTVIMLYWHILFPFKPFNQNTWGTLGRKFNVFVMECYYQNRIVNENGDYIR